MIIVIAIFTSFILIAGMMRFLVKDFAKFIIQKTKPQVFPQGFIDFGEYFTTWFFTFIIAFLGFLFYKFGTILLAYLLSGDLLQFFVILRNVFTIKSEVQNPFIFQHLMAGFVSSPALQFLACFVIYKSIRSFMLLINSKYGSNVYNESDLLYFNFMAVLIFMYCDIISFSQDIPAVSGFAHFIYLGISKLACVSYYLTIAHNHLLQSSEYKKTLPEYISLKVMEAQIINTPWKNLLLTYFIGVVLNAPFVLGTQFLNNNLNIILICFTSCIIFYLILKKLLAKGYNYVGAILFYHRLNIESVLLDSKPRKFKYKKYVLIIAGILLISFSIYKPKILFFILSIISFFIILFLLFYLLFYFIFLGYSVWRARHFKHGIPTLLLPALQYGKSTIISLSKSVSPVIIFILLVTMLLGIAPKKYKYKPDETYVTSVLGSDGEALHIKYNDNNSCIPIPYSQLPAFAIKCLRIQEDRDFFNQDSWFPHLANWHGVSIASLYRSFAGGGGGSNLDMQLIKNSAFQSGFPVDIQRKFSETITAFQLSLQLSPEQIVTQYFNKVSWNGGKGHSGIMLGSLYTFGVPVEKLNQLEILYMVQSLKRASSFKIDDSLINYQDAALYRYAIKKALLEQATLWCNQELISKKELAALKNQELRFVNSKYKSLCQTSSNDFLNGQIAKQGNICGTYNSSISSTNVQAMQSAVNDFDNELKQYLRVGKYDLFSSAIVINIHTGQILAHYGSDNITDLTTLGSGRNMGSLMKPFVICELLETGFRANDIQLYDGPLIGKTTPKNYSRHYSYRYVGIDEALGKSLNAPLVNVRQLTNPIALFNRVENHFAQMGIASDPNLQLNNKRMQTVNTLNYPLGSRNMTLFNIAQAYQTLFNEGKYIKLSAFDGYYNPYKDSTVLFPKVSKQVYEASNANRVKAALNKTMINGGTANHLNKILATEKMMYAKTGTTDKQRDGYCVLTDGEILIISFVSYGKITNNHLRLGLAPIPLGSGGRSAGILSALLYNRFSNLN